MSTFFTERHAVSPSQAGTFDTGGLRQHFLIDDLFAQGEISLTYTHYDRMVVGGAVPGTDPLPLGAIKPGHRKLPRPARIDCRQHRR